MPAGAFQQDSVGIRINNLADLLTLRAHGLAVAPGHDQAGAVALGRADRPEEVGPICDLIVGTWARVLRRAQRRVRGLPDQP